MSKHGWTYKNFEECLQKIKTPSKIKSSEYFETGKYPVVSQEQDFISGYNDSSDKVFHHDMPVVIFGDHSRVVKYVDFDFIIGADGVKIFLVKDDINSKFFYYYIKWIDVESLGYSRHYKVLKENDIPVPGMAEQEAIVAELDEINEAIAALQQQVADLDTLAQSTFYEMFGDPVTNPHSWPVKKWDEVLTIINGKNQKDVENTNGQYPICGSGGIMGYADSYLCPEYTTIIGRKGNINNPIYMKEKFWNVDTAFGLVANTKILLPIFLFYFCRFYDFETHNVAVTIPSLRKADLLKINIPVPPLALQREFAERVEAIEAAKAELSAQIAELQTLLASRMDFWFAPNQPGDP